MNDQTKNDAWIKTRQEEAMKEYAAIGSKLVKITDALQAVPEDATNEYDNYSYTSYKALNAKLRPLLKKHQLMIIPEITEIDQESMTIGDKHWVRSRAQMKFQLLDCETGFFITKIFYGEDRDIKGKSLAQAITACQKQFEMKLFHVSIYADEEEETPTITEDELSQARSERLVPPPQEAEPASEEIPADNEEPQETEEPPPPEVEPIDVLRKMFQLAFAQSKSKMKDLNALNEYVKQEHDTTIPKMIPKQIKLVMKKFKVEFEPTDSNLERVGAQLGITKSDTLKLFISGVKL